MGSGELLEWLLKGLGSLMFGFLLFRVKKGSDKSEKAVTKTEARQLFSDMVEPIERDNQRNKEDIRDMKQEIRTIRLKDK